MAFLKKYPANCRLHINFIIVIQKYKNFELGIMRIASKKSGEKFSPLCFFVLLYTSEIFFASSQSLL